MGSYTLGLDIGSNSIGWALVETKKKPSIVSIGVRVFPEGVDRDTKGLEKSKNATRREARGARRTHQRRNLRKEQLLKTLQKVGFLPTSESELRSLFHTNPYGLRKKGLDEKLERYEFGRVLYHINQRRGFKSNRKSGEPKEEGKVKKEAGELQKMIEKAGCRTIGEYFAGLNPEEQRIRERYTFRSMYEEEFDLLWAKQSKFYPSILTEELRKKIKNEIIFFQRPLKPTEELIGHCGLEPEEKRCPRGDWYARRFRFLQDVNNLKIHNSDGSVNELTEKQRQIILVHLSKSKEVKLSKLRKVLGLLETQEFNAEYETNEKGKRREKLKGDEFNASMRSKKIFGPKVWDAMDEAMKIKLNEWLVDLDDDELIEKLTAECGLNEGQIEAVLRITLPQRYMSFSRKAIQKLLPLMERGKRTDEALDEVYPDRNKLGAIEQKDKLDLPGDLRNPIVNRALFEARKVANAIVRDHGKPGRIRIEMARDVRGSARERRELHFKMLENERRNKEVREKLKDMGLSDASRDDIIKYKLWEECGRVCPYTGKTISQEALFSTNPEFQIEHILPYDRSLDDSYMNKTLCEVHENIHIKKDQTPYEAYNSNPERYEEIKQRVNKTAMPYWKKQKFWQKEIDTEQIISRELNDTRYINREIVKYLKQICSNVRGTRGKATAELRYQWGLIKDRDDHRHHSIDAAVVAVTRPEHLRQLGKSKYSNATSSFPPPWPHFREELAEKAKHINVSHRVTRRARGRLHDETSYGATGRKDEKEQDIFVYRKKLEDLTGAMVEKIVDPVVKEIVKERLREKGYAPEEKSTKLPKDIWQEPLYMKTTKSNKKVPIKKVRIRDVFNNMIFLNDREGRPYRAVAPGNNHHIEIFEYTDKRGNIKREGKVITMFEAVQRSQQGKPIVKKDYSDGKRFVCSLAINEMFMLEMDNGLEELYRVQKISRNGQIYLRPHTYAGDLKKQKGISKLPNKLKGHKVTVDMLGRVHMAND